MKYRIIFPTNINTHEIICCEWHMSNQELLQTLYDQYRSEFGGEEVVVGEGNVHTSLMLVGEAPGKDEVRLSRPFVGAAGKNLNEFLEILGIERESIYITNAIKYRLSKVNPKTGAVSNRPATTGEIERSREYLLKEINIINPMYIVTLGGVPLKAVTGDYGIVIGEHHGRLERVRLKDREYSIFALYHPASIIYNRALKDTYINDIGILKTVLEHTCKN